MSNKVRFGIIGYGRIGTRHAAKIEENPQADEDMNANKYDTQVLSLPIGDHLSREEVSYVTDCIRAFYE